VRLESSENDMLLFIQRPFNTFVRVKEVDEEISLTLLEIFVTFVLAIFFLYSILFFVFLIYVFLSFNVCFRFCCVNF